MRRQNIILMDSKKMEIHGGYKKETLLLHLAPPFFLLMRLASL